MIAQIAKIVVTAIQRKTNEKKSKFQKNDFLSICLSRTHYDKQKQTEDVARKRKR